MGSELFQPVILFGSVASGVEYWVRCPDITQRLMCGDEPKASDSKIGKRQKQAHHHEKPNDGHLKRDGAALIREQGRGGQFVFSGQDVLSVIVLPLALP